MIFTKPLKELEVSIGGVKHTLEHLSQSGIAVLTGVTLSKPVVTYQALVDQRRNLVNNGDSVAYMVNGEQVQLHECMK